jgi:immunity protein Imm1 of predicted polymorphic toxin system
VTVRFFDRQDPTNPLDGTIVEDRKGIREIVRSSSSKEPFLAELVSESGHRLMIGLGTKGGCVQYSANDDPPYLMAVGNPEAFEEEEYVEFLIGDTPTPISTRYLLSLPVVEEVATHFLETGKPSPARSWEEV